MTEQKRKMIQETARQVADVLAKNGATFSDVPRIFREAENYLLVRSDPHDVTGRFSSQASPEKAVDPGLQCLCQHFAVWYAALKNGEPPDFATPCTCCINLGNCSKEGFPWYDKIIPILESQGIQISLIQRRP